MLSYELCKQLKDAGFPKETFYICTACYFEQHEIGHVENEPTLEELIEACGERFENLYYKPQLKGYDDVLVWSTNSCGMSCGDTHGNTPSEAVAKLWLELNK